MYGKIRIFLAVIFTAISLQVAAQVQWPSPEVEQLYQKARGYLSKGNFSQAIVSYQQLIGLAPDVMIAYRDLGQSYYFSRSYAEAEKTLSSVIKNGNADVQCYQLCAASLEALGEPKKARKTLKKGLEKFPRSGLLYHELGKEYDNSNETQNALNAWVDGIKADASFHTNYYDAARMFMATRNMIWVIIYGEIFINMEHETARSYETRKMVFAAYKHLFQTPDMQPSEYGKTKLAEPRSFEEAVKLTLSKLAPVVAGGITTDNLTMLRTRFNMEWSGSYADKYPFSLFTYHNKLLKLGYFEAYNQWLFGKVENQQQFDSWNKFHPGVAAQLQGWMNDNPFAPMHADFYYQ